MLYSYDGVAHFYDAVLTQFMGKESDSESNLDDFDARYYASSLGRFMSPDWSPVPSPVPHGEFSNPQSLNLYGYVKNNPTTFQDLDGHCCDFGDVIDFVKGLSNADVSDNALGAGRQQQSSDAGKLGAAVGDTIAAAQVGLEAVLGAGGEVSGFTLDLTGIGAAFGIPVNVASGLVIAHGGATAIEVASNLAKDGASAIQGAMESRSSGPKASDAPGVTAGGQATNHS